MSSDSSVTVARYDTTGSARLAKARLEDAGIPCLLANEDQAGLSTMFDATTWGVQVKVPEEQADEARSILEKNGFGS